MRTPLLLSVPAAGRCAAPSVALWALLLGSGCGSSTILVRNEADITQLNARAEGKQVRVLTHSGRRYEADSLSVTESLTMWWTPAARFHPSWPDSLKGRWSERPTSDISSISFRTGSASTVNGLKYGALVGSVIGLAVWAADDGGGFIEVSPGIVPGLAAIGGMVGMIVGGLGESWSEFVLQQSETPRHQEPR